MHARRDLDAERTGRALALLHRISALRDHREDDVILDHVADHRACSLCALPRSSLFVPAGLDLSNPSRGLFVRANSAGASSVSSMDLNDEPLSTGPGDARGGDRPVDGESRDAGGSDPEALASSAFPVEGVSDRDRGGGPDHGTPRQASRLVAHARLRLPEGLHARGSQCGPRAGGGDPRRAGRSRPTGSARIGRGG